MKRHSPVKIPAVVFLFTVMFFYTIMMVFAVYDEERQNSAHHSENESDFENGGVEKTSTAMLWNQICSSGIGMIMNLSIGTGSSSSSDSAIHRCCEISPVFHEFLYRSDARSVIQQYQATRSIENIPLDDWQSDLLNYISGLRSEANSDSPQTYPENCNNEDRFHSHQVETEAYDVKKITTKGLWDLICSSGIGMTLMLYSDREYGIRSCRDKNSALNEFLNRSDAQCVILAYEEIRSGEGIPLDCWQEDILSFIEPTRSEEAIVYTMLHTPVNAYRMLSDMTDEQKAVLNQCMEESHPNACLLRSATRKYNCHSYAWYDQSLTNDIWLPFPLDFKTDGYFVTNSWQPGDILVFSNGTEDIHSAIIEITDGTILGTIVISKWGNFGLYRHALVDCPYSVANLTAYRICPHSFDIQFFSIYLHQLTCTSCGYITYETHSIHPITGRCTKCGYKAIAIEPTKGESNP